MKKIISPLLLPVLFVSCLQAQNAGIGTNFPDPSAMLDISGNTKGLLIPRMSTTAITSISNPAKGLLVFDTAKNQLMVNMGTVFSPNWQTIVYKRGWNLTGNSNTDPSNHFIGTTDAQPLKFRVNNLPAGLIHPSTFNTAFGLNTLSPGAAGTDNTANGANALFFNSTGSSNTATGSGALSLNTTGGYNTANGVLALYHNTTGNFNAATGISALYNNTIGESNTANGPFALYSNSSGANNTAVGFHSLNSNTTGHHNTAIGSEALYSNTTGSYNTANGNVSLYYNLTGQENTATGNGALFYNKGSSNTAMGFSALFNNQNADGNTAIGYNTLVINTTGDHNTATGYEALHNNNTGYENTAIGHGALYHNSSGNYNIAIGANSQPNLLQGTDNIAIGWGAGSCSGFTNLSNTAVIGASTCAQNSNFSILSTPTTIWNGGSVTWSTYSDARIKRNIKEDVTGLSFILKLRPVTYNRSVDDMTRLTGAEVRDYPEKKEIETIRFTGFLAQDVEKAAQECGFDFSGITKPKTPTDLYSLSYESFVVPLVKAMQEQQAIIEQQQKQIDDLKEQNKNILAVLDRLIQTKQK
jgi:hypothetical protein